MIKLEPFQKTDFKNFIRWINSEEELVQFAGSILSFPVTNEKLEVYINLPKLKPLKIIDSKTNKTIGHCELNFTNPIPRLSRILIGNKKYRNRGLGTLIIQKMIEEILLIQKTETVDLNVFEHNNIAINTYLKGGFEIQENKKSIFIHKTKEFTLLNMVKKLT